MPNLVAMHEIIQKGADGKREVIAPGTAFTANGIDADFYLKVGAARESDVIEGEVDTGAGDDEGQELAKLKKAELLEMARSSGADVSDALTKAELITLIQGGGTEPVEDEESLV